MCLYLGFKFYLCDGLIFIYVSWLISGCRIYLFLSQVCFLLLILLFLSAFFLFFSIIVIIILILFSISTDWGIPKDICSYILYLEEFVFLTPLPYDIWKAYFRQLIPNGVFTEERDDLDIASEKEGASKEGTENNHVEEGRVSAHGDHFDCIKLGQDVASSFREVGGQEVDWLTGKVRVAEKSMRLRVLSGRRTKRVIRWSQREGVVALHLPERKEME